MHSGCAAASFPAAPTRPKLQPRNEPTGFHMSLLFRIIYAAHAKGTHHKLALDALRQLTSPETDRWQRLFLKHAETYLAGSKAPDDQFKDFKNHVLHVRDNYWGGALGKADEWYGALCAALRAQDWENVAWSAGVLSHYITDPIQPFHTGQSDAENAIHRAAEWSISRSYDDIRKQGVATSGDFVLTAGDGASWLRALICAGAEKANVHYETLIGHYDLKKGVVDPPAGLDGLSRKILGDLVVYASAAVAAALDRAFAETGAVPPDVDLGLDTIMAALKIPAKTLAKRLADAEDRAVVMAMYDELNATGRVDKTLPEDDRVVRDLHAAEVEAPRLAERAVQRAAVLAAAVPTAAAVPPPLASVPAAPVVAEPAPSPSLAARLAPLAAAAPAPLRAAPAAQSSGRHYLASGDAIERAPTIGPKMAERLGTQGIVSVADFLSAEPDAVATGLGGRSITGDTIRLWQDQCQLMLDIADLRGGHAELLAQAGFRTAEAIAEADEAKLCADVLAFAGTAAGQRILRDGAPPDLEKIKGWLAAAQTAKAA